MGTKHSLCLVWLWFFLGAKPRVSVQFSPPFVMQSHSLCSSALLSSWAMGTWMPCLNGSVDLSCLDLLKWFRTNHKKSTRVAAIEYFFFYVKNNIKKHDINSNNVSNSSGKPWWFQLFFFIYRTKMNITGFWAVCWTKEHAAAITRGSEKL